LIDLAERDAIARARDLVLARIDAAARRAGRNPDDIELVAVTKTVSAERVRAAIAVGLDILGENRVQEAADKRPETPGATWHLVGPLQSNKAGRALETFDVIESVDSVELATRLSRLALEMGRAPSPVLLQVNVDADPAKAGFRPEALAASLPAMLDLAGIRVDGLMTIGRLVTEPEAARPTFVALRSLGERLRAAQPRLGPSLSMGMSDDFEVAVEEGATHVRVGRALFGART
jgi:pyridoxal phosphate enzyme (YggS family)